MDRNYRRTASVYRKENGLDESTPIDLESAPDFPIEHARQRNLHYVVIIFIFCTGAYGYSLALDVDLPLILQFLISYTATAVFSVNSALIVDLLPGMSASATATNNLSRCSLGAVGVATAQPIVNRLTPKYTFLTLAIVALVSSPLAIVESKWGPGWRMEREARWKREREGGAKCKI